MAAALSLLGEINNALNPQPRTPRGQAWVKLLWGVGGWVTPWSLESREAGQRPLDGLGP